ncbi:MAG: Phosphocholine transferase AnkX [Wolbachia endosymbiont of Ctenocephalides felis wCfeJ]|nr:MAG: Phosphocholine transferase AnkX [Wolbachia endosymbiont of Ctenocephalides felis wCfeJ]
MEVVKFLVDKGASINAKDRFGWTPLHSAAVSNTGNIAKLLIDMGADINAKNDDNKTPFELACKNGKTEVASFLATVQDNRHRTALHYAAQEGNLKLVGLLIEKGADVNAKDNEGKTPLDLAKANHIEIVSLLEESMRKEKEEILSTDTRSRRSVEDDNIMIKNNQATSRGSKPSLWINGLFGWAKGSIGELFGFQAVVPEKLGNSREQSLPGISQHNKTVKTSNAGSFLNSENVALVVCMRDVLDALDDAPSKRYQKLTSQGIEVIPNTSVAVQFALKKFNSFVKDEISNLGSKEKAIVRAELKRAYPKIKDSLRRGVEFSGNVGLDNVLKECKKCFCKNVFGEDKVSTCFSNVEVGGFGNNLNR